MKHLLALNNNSGGIKINSNTGNNSNQTGSGSGTGTGGNANNFTLVKPGKITDVFNGKSLLQIGTMFINFLLAMIVIAAVVVIVIAGFKMVLGGANESQIAKQKKAIVYAIAGLVVAFMSFAIVQIVQNFIQK